MPSNKPNCYTCKYRRLIPGDRHSRCGYPGTATNVLDLYSSENKLTKRKLGIKAEPEGVRGGWFVWPVNYDPVWLVNCNGFTPQENNK